MSSVKVKALSGGFVNEGSRALFRQRKIEEPHNDCVNTE